MKKLMKKRYCRSPLLFLLFLCMPAYSISTLEVDQVGKKFAAERDRIQGLAVEAKKELLEGRVISDEIYELLFTSNMNERGIVYLGESIEIDRDDTLRDIINHLNNLMVEKDDPVATTLLSLMYIYNFNDCAQGVELLKKAVEKKLVSAFTELGRLYEFGLCGYQQSYETAIEWYGRSVKSGDPDAMFRMSILVFNGIDKSKVDWFDLLLNAAKKGLPKAQELLARVYSSKGREYYDRSFAWYLIAYVQGVDVLDKLYEFRSYDINLDSIEIINIVSEYGQYRYYMLEYVDFFDGSLSEKK